MLADNEKDSSSTTDTTTDNKKTSKKPLTLSLKKTVSVDLEVDAKKASGKRTVTVEVKKKRSFSRGNDGKMVAEDRQANASPAQQEAAPSKETDNTTPSAADDNLTHHERDSRLRALKEADERQKQEKLDAIEREKELEAQRKLQEELAKNAPEEEVVEEEAALEEKKSSPMPAPIAPADLNADKAKGEDKLVLSKNEESSGTHGKKQTKTKEYGSKDEKHASKTSRRDDKRRSGKISIMQALAGDEENERVRSLASIKRAREKARRKEGQFNQNTEKTIREVIVPEVITVQELSNRMAVRGTDVIRSLMKMGMLVKLHDTIDADTAELIIEEYGHTIRRVTESDIENILLKNTKGEAVSRAPVVTIMGHVDHGKTSLLDAIRSANIVADEAGGITQHIGAYRVKVTPDSDQYVTFLDTPGHEAFTAMRLRGAHSTDIVVLVVAADDGIMEQTVEAINHAKAAEVPIIVAINKIDKPESNPERVVGELLQHDVIAESMGGDVMVVEVSAKEKTNLDKLIETIQLQAEILELQAPIDGRAEGVVVESEVDKRRGVVTTVLVQSGTLEIGDILVAGLGSGRVRAMNDDHGRPVELATPSVPVEILGLDEAPEAGETLHVVENERDAKEIVEYRVKRARDLKSAHESTGNSLEALFSKASGSGVKELPVIIRADVHGSAEAIVSSLTRLNNEEVAIKVLHSATGAITESDITLANASNALVLGFNVRANAAAKEIAEEEGVRIRYYSIIYNVVDDVKSMLSNMLEPDIKEKYLGAATIRQVFNITKYGRVAGCYVTDGVIKRGAGVRLLRDNVVIHEGKLKTLKRFKDEVKEVATQYECGMAFENYEDIKVDDTIEAFEFIEVERTL